MRQLPFDEVQNEQRQFPIVVICENFLSPENVGMAFRLCEAMGVEHLYLSGSTPAPPNRKLAKAARSAHKRLPYTHEMDCEQLYHRLKATGYALVGLEIADQSQDLRSVDFKKYPKLALVAGAERYGLSAATLRQLDAAVHVPMFGVGSSMNVVTALSVGLYEVVRQWTGCSTTTQRNA